MVAVVQVNRGYFLWQSVLTRVQTIGVEIKLSFFFFFSFSLCLQILELEKKIVRQNQIAVKVKQANSSKRLQKQIETLEMRLNNVSKHFADLWRPCAGPHLGLCTKCAKTKRSGQRAMVQTPLVGTSCIKDLACSPGLIAPRISQRLLQAW